ncbi:hypothetical protein ACQ86N_00260 [Puia sp. P3]|uniref:hypothetical protein n=1 Tax=Puia sp. P3 TaxID=3423952 RepID=UPI003D671855
MDEFTTKMFLNDNVHPYIQDKPFDWIRGYHVGGRSLMWGKMDTAMGDGGFRS